MKRFENKVCLVTGAASGIGRATAQRLGREGATLLLADLNEKGLAELREELSAANVASAAIGFDALDEASCRGMVARAAEQFGRLDVVCNIAGTAGASHFLELKKSDWDRMLAVNLTSLFVICQESIPHLKATRGNIVNMASASARMGSPYFSHYAVSKAGVVSLTRSLAVEFSQEKIRVNAVCPGGVSTPLSSTYQMPENMNMDLLRRLFSLHEEGTPDEIASAVAYLASPEARYVSGAIFSIDGAQTA